MLGFRAERKVSDEHNAPVFPEVFKREAVDRVISSGLPAGKVATELGLNETVVSPLPLCPQLRAKGCRQSIEMSAVLG
jgi:hypothetical protein